MNQACKKARVTAKTVVVNTERERERESFYLETDTQTDRQTEQMTETVNHSQ